VHTHKISYSQSQTVRTAKSYWSKTVVLRYKKTRSPTGCQWPSRSSKINDFHLVWYGVCHFLLVIISNLGSISHHVRDMAVEKHTLFLPPPFNPQFENVPLALDGWNFACPSVRHMANYSCKKFSRTTFPLARVHLLQTNRRTVYLFADSRLY